jgi:hypothetical protein
MKLAIVGKGVVLVVVEAAGCRENIAVALKLDRVRRTLGPKLAPPSVELA